MLSLPLLLALAPLLPLALMVPALALMVLLPVALALLLMLVLALAPMALGLLLPWPHGPPGVSTPRRPTSRVTAAHPRRRAGNAPAPASSSIAEPVHEPAHSPVHDPVHNPNVEAIRWDPCGAPLGSSGPCGAIFRDQKLLLQIARRPSIPGRYSTYLRIFF